MKPTARNKALGAITLGRWISKEMWATCKGREGRSEGGKQGKARVGHVSFTVAQKRIF